MPILFMQIGIEDVRSITGEWRSVGARISVVANGLETKVIAKYIDRLQAIANEIITEIEASKDAKK